MSNLKKRFYTAFHLRFLKLFQRALNYPSVLSVAQASSNQNLFEGLKLRHNFTEIWRNTRDGLSRREDAGADDAPAMWPAG